jgi:outer membrane receptor protein involved in Fe transport
LIANYATSYIPPATNAFDMNNELVKPVTGLGYDGGLRFHLFGDRLTFNTSYFFNRENFQRTTPPVTTAINNLLSRNVATDPSTDGRNTLGLPAIFGTDYQSLKTSGVELEIVGKITRGWRLMFNLGTASVFTFNRWPQSKPFVDQNADFYRQVLVDAGGRLDTSQHPNGAPGLAVINSAVIAAIPAEQTNAVLDYNNIWANYSLVTGDLPVAGVNRRTVNVFSDYTIQTGTFKGLRVGVGARDRGSIYIMSRSADTIVNPANPTAAIDDPAVSQTTPVYAKYPIIMNGTLGYTVRLKGWGRLDGKELVCQLAIQNLMDTRRPVYSGTQGSVRPPDGDYSKPNRIAVPSRVYELTEPRSLMLTTTLRL